MRSNVVVVIVVAKNLRFVVKWLDSGPRTKKRGK
jgi:hypothetical protein